MIIVIVVIVMIVGISYFMFKKGKPSTYEPKSDLEADAFRFLASFRIKAAQIHSIIDLNRILAEVSPDVQRYSALGIKFTNEWQKIITETRTRILDKG